MPTTAAFVAFTLIPSNCNQVGGNKGSCYIDLVTKNKKNISKDNKTHITNIILFTPTLFIIICCAGNATASQTHQQSGENENVLICQSE